MIDPKWAANFADEWIAAWNSHDLNRILSHYAETIVFRSPRIAAVTGKPVNFVSGKEALARYWEKGLSLSPDLRFELDRLYIGSDGLSIAYRNHRGQNVVETFVFNTDHMVIESIAAYAP